MGKFVNQEYLAFSFMSKVDMHSISFIYLFFFKLVISLHALGRHALLSSFLLKTFLTAEWITEYHQSRPGLKVLQQRIDEFITDHEAKLEQVFSFSASLS